MKDKQHFFVTERIERIEVPFIGLLDSPISPTNGITLRRAIMSRAPRSDPTKRLIHNVDYGWQDTHRTYITTVKQYVSEAHEFISSLIPEMVFRYGQDCQSWFTAEGLSFFESVSWNPDTMKTTSSADEDTQNLLDEDLWGLGDDWRVENNKKELPVPIGTSILKNNKNRVTIRNLEDDEDIKSFASAFGNHRNQPTPTPPPDSGHTKVGGTVTLSAELSKHYASLNLPIATLALCQQTQKRRNPHASNCQSPATLLTNRKKPSNSKPSNWNNFGSKWNISNARQFKNSPHPTPTIRK